MSRLVGLGLCLMACTVWVGWALDIRFLKQLWSAEASMKPVTALALFLGGGVLFTTRPLPGRRWKKELAAACSRLMLVVGCACVLAKVLDWGESEVSVEGVRALWLHPSWATATCMILGAVALLTLGSSRGWAVVTGRVTTLGVGLIAGVALMAYLLGVADLYEVVPYHTMALHTATGFFLLSVGICLAHPEQGIVAQLLRDDAGGAVARQLFPAVLGAPLVVGMVVSLAEQGRVIGPRLALGIVVVLVVVGGMFAVGSTARYLSVSDAARRESERRIRLMLAELDHRVKNTMAAVLSMCEQTAIGCRSIEEFKKTYRGRLQAMARAHDALAATKWKGVSFGNMVSTVVGAYSFIDGRAMEMRGEEIVLPSSAALPLAMTLNELATNAVKHGAWSNPSAVGKVRVTWRIRDNDRLEVDWEESGGPPPGSMPDGGFGVSLIRGMIPHEMGGTVELAAEATGVRCRISLSLHEAEAKTEAKYSLAS
jgi:two-component sensor histidine kinase